MALTKDQWKKMAQEVDELDKNGGKREYKDVPDGEYEVKITKLEYAESKKDRKPMLACSAKILKGEQKGEYLNIYFMLDNSYGMHLSGEFLRDLDTDVDVKFKGDIDDYKEQIADVFEALDGKLEYGIKKVTKDKYSNYEITDVFEVE